MSSAKEFKIINAWICQVSEKEIVPVFGDIFISEGRISDIKKKDFNELFLNSSSGSKETIDAAGRVVTVPMINFHDHFYSRLAKGLPVKGSMKNFKKILQNLWWKLDLALDDEMIRASAQMAVLESIRNGVTYIFDHHSSPDSAEGSLNTIANVIREFGLRGVLCFETTDRNGELLAEKGILENIDFIKNSTDNDLKGLLGLHASFTLNDDTLNKVSEIAKEHDLGIHIHLCEDKIDREDSFTNYKNSPVNRLIKYNLLNDRSILAHGIHLTEKEYKLIKENGSALAYNLDSNLNNAVGIPDFTSTKFNIPVLAGTDGMNSDPARTLKQIFLLSRFQGMSFDESFKFLKKVYFDQLNFIRKYYPDFTTLGVSDRADILIWDYIPPTPFKQENFWGHFIYGILDRQAQSVIQNGKILMNNFRITFDDTEYQKNIVEQGNRLYKKMSELN